MRLLRYLLPLLLCAALFGQGTTALPKTTILPKTTAVTGSALPTVTKIGQVNFANAAPYTITASGNAAAGDTILLTCVGQGANAGTHYTFSASDSVSNSWTFPTVSTNTSLQFLDTSNQEAITVPFAATIATGYTSGVTTVTVNNSAVSDGATGGCDLWDIKGLIASPFDNAVGATEPFQVPFPTGTYTPAAQPEVVIAIFCASTGGVSAYGNIISIAATGLDNRTGGTNSANQSDLIVEWRRVTALTAGTGTATQTATGDGAGSIIMGFKSH